MDTGDFAGAAVRYERFLAAWPPQGDLGVAVCSDLIRCYLQCGEHIRAVLLAGVMRSQFAYEDSYRDLLPLLVEVYEKAGMRQAALELVEQSQASSLFPAGDPSLMLEKARLLVELGSYAEAGETLAALETAGDDRLLHAAQLLRARMHMERKEYGVGLDLCRKVALESKYDALRADALRIIGAYYEREGEFDRAALTYAGSCPPHVDGGNE
jgi:tetratricopeptide (TPR) repeat protein